MGVAQAAVDLVGRHVIYQSDLIDSYFADLLGRLMDKGVSVRKSVVRILSSVLLVQPGYKHELDICRRLVARHVDALEEETIKNLVLHTFQNLWFNTNSASKVKALGTSAAENLLVSPELGGFGAGGATTPSGVPVETPTGLPVNWTEDEASGQFVSPFGQRCDTVQEAWKAAELATTPKTPLGALGRRSDAVSTQATAVQMVGLVATMPSAQWLSELVGKLLFDQV